MPEPLPLELVVLTLHLLSIPGRWSTVAKAGLPGWSQIVPIFDLIMILRVAQRPWWWLLFLIVPFVNLIMIVKVLDDVGQKFGKGLLTTIGLVFLPFITWSVLGFGSAEYQARSAVEGFE